MEMLIKLPLAHRAENVFEILKQKFLEFLCEDKINDAILCLQDELGKVVEDNGTSSSSSSHKLRDALHELTQTLLLNPEELRKKHCGNENSYKHSRENVLKTIMQRIDERAATPESRLDTLLVQALEYQMNRASFRYTENRCFSLLSNHTCNDVKIPTKSVRILDSHKDEVSRVRAWCSRTQITRIFSNQTPKQVWHISFSNDGTSLATASKDGTVIIWENLENDNEDVESKSLIGHSGPVIFVTWSHDDTRVLSSSVTHRIKLWNVQTEQCLRTFTRHTGDPVTLAFLPCGTKFVSGGVDKLVLLWDLESCDVCSQWIGDAVRIFSYVISRENQIRNSNTNTRTQVHDLAVSSDGEKIYTASSSKEIHEYRTFCVPVSIEKIIRKSQHTLQHKQTRKAEKPS